MRLSLRILPSSSLLLAGVLALLHCSGGDNNNNPDAGGTTPMGGQVGNCRTMGPDSKVIVNWEGWVAREDANEVRIINGPQFVQRRMIDLSPTMLTHPHSISFSADESVAYVAMTGTAPAYSDGGLVLVDTTMRKVSGQIAVKADVVFAAARPGATNEVWAVSSAGDAVKVIATDTSSVTKTIKIGATGSPVQIRFSSDGSKAYVVSSGTKNMKSAVSIIDTAMKKVTGSYATGAGSSAAAISFDDKTMWVANATDNSVESIDLTASDTTMAVKTFAMGVGGASSVATTKYHVIVAATGDGKIEFFTDKGDKAKELMAGGPASVSVSPTCVRAYFIDTSMSQFVEVQLPSVNGNPDLANYKLGGHLDLMGMSPVGLIIRWAPSAM